MPWIETCPMDERLKLGHLYETGKFTVTELAQHFGISRKSANKWLTLFRKDGLEGLAERSSAPQHHPNTTAEMNWSCFLFGLVTKDMPIASDCQTCLRYILRKYPTVYTPYL